jgi:hypothetical protein
MATQNDYIYIGIYSRKLDEYEFENEDEWCENVCGVTTYTDDIRKYFPNVIKSVFLPVDVKGIAGLDIVYKIPNENVPINYKERIANYQKEMSEINLEIIDDVKCIVVLPFELNLQVIVGIFIQCLREILRHQIENNALVPDHLEK